MSDRAHPHKRRAKIKKILIGIGVFAAVFLVVVQIAEVFTERQARYVPDYEKISLRTMLEEAGSELTEEGYEALFWQTGLGKDAADAIWSARGDSIERLETFQDDFFHAKAYQCDKVGIITREEHFVDEDGKVVRGFALADVRNGDILVTKATHSFGWRHGHAAIVIDAQLGKTVEAVMLGDVSKEQPLSKWRTYPTVIQLRWKDPEVAEAAALYAEEHLIGVPYGLLAGLLPRPEGTARTTQCADLPWIAYAAFGVDLGNGIWPVTPKKIANDESLAIVQIYGVPPDAPWSVF